MADKEQQIIEIEEDMEPWMPRMGEMGNIISAIAEDHIHFKRNRSCR